MTNTQTCLRMFVNCYRYPVSKTAACLDRQPFWKSRNHSILTIFRSYDLSQTTEKSQSNCFWANFRLRSKILPQQREKEVNPSEQEANRLTETYGPPWPEKCSQLTSGWYDGLPDWTFKSRNGNPRPKQSQIDELKSVHVHRMDSLRKKRKACHRRRHARYKVKY